MEYELTFYNSLICGLHLILIIIKVLKEKKLTTFWQSLRDC